MLHWKFLLLFPFNVLRFGNIFLVTYVVSTVLLTHMILDEGQNTLSIVLARTKIRQNIGPEFSLVILWLYELLHIALNVIITFVAFTLPVHVQWYTDQRLILEFFKYSGPAARKALETAALALTASIFYLVPLFALSILYFVLLREQLPPLWHDLYLSAMSLVLIWTITASAPLLFSPWTAVLGWVDPSTAVREGPQLVGKNGLILSALLVAGLFSALLIHSAFWYFGLDTREQHLLARCLGMLSLWYWNAAICGAILTLLEELRKQAA
jgi:hypothetical protein